MTTNKNPIFYVFGPPNLVGDYQIALRMAGLEVLDDGNLLPGDHRQRFLRSADIVFFLFRDPELAFGSGWRGVDDDILEWVFRHAVTGEIRAIPVLIDKVHEGEIPFVFSRLIPVRVEGPDAPKGLARIARELAGRLNLPENGDAKKTSARPGPLLELGKLTLTKVGCFNVLEISFKDRWSTILGDNSSGKSTLLRSLALGLCTESEAAALIKSLPGPVLRHGAEAGAIRLELQEPSGGPTFHITTEIYKGPAGDEVVRKATEPKENFPWERIFLCGYGTNRSRRATESHDDYSVLAAIRPLFDDSVPLQNSEVVLLRQENGLRRSLEASLLNILMLEGARFDYAASGPVIEAQWGKQPIRSLSDGYRSTIQWVLDFCGWAIHAGRFGPEGIAGGILLIDELEQHLHPRWQRYIVARLRRQFPTTQIIVSTHTPLVAAGAADIESAQVVRLLENDEGSIEALGIRPEELWGLRADQILTSEAFGLITSANVGSETELDRYSALLGLAERTKEEEVELDGLRVRLRDHFRLGETETEREAEGIVEKVLDELNTNLDKEHLGFEARQMLQDLLRPRNEE